MKKVLFVLMMIASLFSASAYAQSGNWKFDYFTDQFGDTDYSKPFLSNNKVRGQYYHLYIRFFFDSFGVPVLVFDLYENSDNSDCEVWGPTKLSIKKTSTGVINNFTADKTEGGDMIFFGDNAINIGKLLHEGNYKLSLNVEKYNQRKTYAFSATNQTTGLADALRKWGK